jgi:hypothetical protein
MVRPAGIEPTTHCLEGSIYITFILIHNIIINNMS